MAIPSTASWLRSQSWADLAILVLFDGENLGYTTHDDVAGIQAAWAAVSNRTIIKGGLDFFGDVTDQAKPFDGMASITPSQISFTIQDWDDTLLSTLLKEAPNDAAQTELTKTLGAADTAEADVNTTAAAAASGTLRIGLEQLDYATKAAGKFQTLTRGKFTLFGTSSGASFGQAHEVDTDTGNAGYQPRVTLAPANSTNRIVGVYIMHRVNGVWSAGFPGTTANDAILYWAGRLKTYQEDGQGTYQLSCLSITELLQTSLLARQYTGTLAEGMWLSPDWASFRVHVDKITAAGAVTQYESTYVSLPNTGQTRTHAQIASDINTQLQAWFNSGSVTFPTTQNLTLTLGANQGGLRYAFTFKDTAAIATDTYHITVYLAPQVWSLLGWDPHQLTSARDDSSANLFVSALEYGGKFPSDFTFIYFAAKDGPLKWGFNEVTGAIDSSGGFWSITVDNIESGTAWTDQPIGSLPGNVNQGARGYLQVGDADVYAVAQTGVANVFAYYENVAKKIAPLGTFNDNGNSDIGAKLIGVRDDFSGEKIPVKQIWIQKGTVADLFLKLLVSTGSSGYNHATFDTFPLGMGVGMPWTAIDETSFRGLSDDPYVLVLEKPTQYAKLFANQLALQGKYCVWRSDLGKLAIVAAGVDSTATISLNENNKAKQITDPTEQVIERTTVQRNVDGLINRVTLQYQRALDDSYKRTIVINNITSQSDFKQTKGITIQAPGLYEDWLGLPAGPGPTADRLLADALAHFGRPTCIATRSYDFSLEAQLYVGARVSIIDNAMVNSATGTRGVNGLLGQVLSKKWNWRRGVGEVRVLFFPELDPLKMVLPAPSARVDETYSVGSFVRGYDAANKILRLKPNDYSDSSQASDMSRFQPGDAFAVWQLSSSTPHSWFDSIASVDVANNQITLTTGLTVGTSGDGNAWATTGALGGFYVLEYDDVTAPPQASQLVGSAWIAAHGTLTTGIAARDFYVWGSPPSAPLTTTRSYTQRYRKHGPNDGLAGQPLSTRILFDNGRWMQTAWAHHTVQHLINEMFATGINGGITRNIIFGPIQIPLYGGTRQLVAKLRVQRVAGAGSGKYTVITSIAPPTGLGGVSFIGYKDGGIASSSFTTANAGPEWISIPAWTPAVVPGSPPYCFLTIEQSPVTGGWGGSLLGVFVREVEMT